MNPVLEILKNIYPQKDKLWAITWIGGLMLLWLWDLMFLNNPALRKLEAAFFNTLFIGLLVILFSLILAWMKTMLIHFSKERLNGILFFPVKVLVNLIRSIPQILGILIGYVFVTRMLEKTTLGTTTIMIFLALIISLFVFLEISDLMLERIDHFKKTDFYNASRVCGISDFHIINFDILYKNSWIHLFNKLIAVFGMTIFLICSIDFIVSVGLSTDVSAINLPSTLGSMLAQIDSKQDILAIGSTLTNPLYFPNLFLRHLQGISVSFLIVFTLFCVYKISDGFARRYHI
ncbi:MAG: ABC transporter permease [Calditrichaeota bacterium]|nr:MAG: ABC transporter permease [Calditrichota bacterium]MBL1206380.1 ABC transporter permease [Calditrichota bacterium]NOG46206.1 ABC transporter permease [Calditrichota bacterium]